VASVTSIMADSLDLTDAEVAELEKPNKFVVGRGES